MIDRLKLPIDLADDEILNPSKRLPILKKESNTNKNLKVDETSNKLIEKKKILQSIKNKKEILTTKKKVINKLNNSDKNLLLKNGEEKLNNKKLDKDEIISNKNSLNILAKNKLFENVKRSTSDNKFNTNLTDIENIKIKKKKRLEVLNATTRVIAKIDQEIADRERDLQKLISNDINSIKFDSKKLDDLSLKKPIYTFVKKNNENILNVCFIFLFVIFFVIFF